MESNNKNKKNTVWIILTLCICTDDISVGNGIISFSE